MKQMIIKKDFINGNWIAYVKGDKIEELRIYSNQTKLIDILASFTGTVIILDDNTFITEED